MQMPVQSPRSGFPIKWLIKYKLPHTRFDDCDQIRDQKHDTQYTYGKLCIHKQLYGALGWFLLIRFVDLVRVWSLHVISKNHPNTFFVDN